ncbi:MAG: amidohydrolase family protein [Eubacteriales bacterium]|nr:amidohydrolase family protein [Clostridiales bacterium]MDY5835639.1 amidohydrolase family protein [Eubacteriales bacterium]
MREYVYYNFSYLDVINKKIVKNCYFRITDGVFSEIDDLTNLSEEEKKLGINLNNAYVTPGLFNIHTHVLSTPLANPASLNYENQGKFALRGYRHLMQYLETGVVFVRDLNGRKQAEIELRDAINEGILIGPHYQVCRQCLTMTGGHGSNTGYECDGIDECRKGARVQLKYGADFLKVMATGGINSPGSERSSQLSEEEIRAIVEIAHTAGKKTAVHAHGTQGIKNAVKAGIDSVEHGTYLDDEALELMKMRGTALVPTLSVSSALTDKNADLSGVLPFQIEKSRKAHEAHIKSFKAAWNAGILIGLGTDGGTPLNPHTDTWREFKAMTDLGCNAFDVLAVGTINSAKIVGVDDNLGSIEKGKFADFVTFEKNPIDDITELSRPTATYLGGRRFIKAELI